MKNLIKIFLLILGIQLANAQKFQKDTIYKIVVNEHETDKEISNFVASLVFKAHPEIVLSSFKVNSASRIENIRIESLKHPELKDVADIIRVDISYLLPYAYTISQYILMTNDVESILLPPIVNINDATPKSETIYVFPNQLFGNVNKITKLEIIYEDAFEIEDVNVLQNYAWNDSDYGNSEHYQTITNY